MVLDYFRSVDAEVNHCTSPQVSTCSGPALVFDGESNPALYRAMLARLMRSVAIEQSPEKLSLWFKLDQALTPGNASLESLTRLVAKLQPGFLVLDPLRQFSSGYDLLKPKEALHFMNGLRTLQSEAPKLRTALPHHLTKRDLNSDSGALADDPWAWLERVSGSLALLDHADVRLGFEEENAKLVLAGIKRGVGIVGPWRFEVENDSSGQACRYRFESLEDSVRARYGTYLDKLPSSYTWTEGRLTLGVAESTMHRFTRAVLQAGLVEQDADKLYRKVEVRK